jgi:hypothetical protein
MLLLIRPKMVSTAWVEEPVADEEGTERAAAAAQKGGKEKQASAGSVTSPPTNTPSAQCGARH